MSVFFGLNTVELPYCEIENEKFLVAIVAVLLSTRQFHWLLK